MSIYMVIVIGMIAKQWGGGVLLMAVEWDLLIFKLSFYTL